MTTASGTDDYVAITRLQSAYADCVTRRAWSELHDLFRPDATLVLGEGQAVRTLEGPDAIGETISAVVDKLDFFVFTNLNTTVELYDDATAGARTYMREVHVASRQLAPREIYGVYLDRYVRVDGRWWFAARRWHALASTRPGLVPHSPPDHLEA